MAGGKWRMRPMPVVVGRVVEPKGLTVYWAVSFEPAAKSMLDPGNLRIAAARKRSCQNCKSGATPGHSFATASSPFAY